MKRFVSLFLAMILLVSAASAALPAYAKAGQWGIPAASAFNPTANEYLVDRTSAQFDFFEEFTTPENLEKWYKDGSDDEWEKEPIDYYYDKLGIGNKNLTEYQKIAKVYYFMTTFGNPHSPTASRYTAPIFRISHCEAGAYIIKMMLEKAGLECYVVGSDKKNHAWNIVKCDGKYYFLNYQIDTSGFMTPVKVVAGDETVDIFYTKYASDGLSSWSEPRTLDWFIKNTGKGKCPSASYPNAYTPSIYVSQDGEKVELSEPHMTVTATSAGYIVNWEPVANADWYDVYAFSLKGFTNDFNINNKNYGGKVHITDAEDTAYYYSKHTPSFTHIAKVHSVDRNENGKYQYFIEGSADEGGKLVYVVAKSVNHQTSCEINVMQMFNKLKVNAYGPSTLFIDKKTGETITEINAITEFPKTNYAISQYKPNHTHNFKDIRVIRKATSKNKGAKVCECTECLQRKIVYLPKYVHNHNWQTTTDIVKATTNKNGYVVARCSLCGEEKSASTIYAVTNISLSNSEYTYDGKEKTPSVTVKDSKGNTLKEGTDYTVTYAEGRTDAGTYSVTVTLKGNYEGKKTLSFRIIPTNNWYTEGGKKYYYDANGNAVKWRRRIDGKLYYFNSAGVLQTGWIKGNNWFYADSKGVLKTGWQKISGTWYYFNTSGAMQTGWQKISGTWYYFNTSGAMQVGWQKISGKWYYFNSSGSMRTANLTYKGKTYRFYSSGACINP